MNHPTYPLQKEEADAIKQALDRGFKAAVPKGSAVCDFDIAINRSYTGSDGQKSEDVTFVNITCWARLAEIVAQYCRKGEPTQGRRQTIAQQAAGMSEDDIPF